MRDRRTVYNSNFQTEKRSEGPPIYSVRRRWACLNFAQDHGDISQAGFGGNFDNWV